MYTDNDVFRIAVAEEPELLFETMDYLESEFGTEEETGTTEETGPVDYTALLEEIIDKQDAIILVQMDTINALNVNQKKQEEIQGVTATLIIGLFVVILIGGACKYLKSIF